VRGLGNVFGSQVVHENLDLNLYEGEILGVVDGSGSASPKSTEMVSQIITRSETPVLIVP